MKGSGMKGGREERGDWRAGEYDPRPGGSRRFQQTPRSRNFTAFEEGICAGWKTGARHEALSAAQFQNALDLDGDIARQRAHADGAPRGTAGLAKDVDHQFAKAVDDLRMPLEIGDRVDHAEDFEHASDAIETSQLSAERGEDGQPDLPRRPLPLLFVEFRPNLAADHAAVGQERSVPRHIEDVARLNDGVVNAGRLRRRREFELQFLDSCVGTHGKPLANKTERNPGARPASKPAWQRQAVAEDTRIRAPV